MQLITFTCVAALGVSELPQTIDSRIENGLETDNLLGSIRVALLRPLQ